MNLVLLKYCLTMLFKRERERERERERDEKMACQRSMTKRDRERERERKDGMPKKHDPANKTRLEKEHVFICALT